MKVTSPRSSAGGSRTAGRMPRDHGLPTAAVPKMTTRWQQHPRSSRFRPLTTPPAPGRPAPVQPYQRVRPPALGRSWQVLISLGTSNHPKKTPPTLSCSVNSTAPSSFVFPASHHTSLNSCGLGGAPESPGRTRAGCFSPDVP